MPELASQPAMQGHVSAVITGDAALLARRYANALYELAEEQKKLDVVAADLRALKLCLQESAEFRFITTQPRLTRKQVLAAMAQLASAAKLDALTTNFLGIISQNRRLSSLPATIDAFMTELANRRGEYTADVVVAAALTADHKAQLGKRLSELAGGTVHMMIREDKSLLGGLVVKVGSQLFDASVKTKLARLERSMKSDQPGLQKGAA